MFIYKIVNLVNNKVYVGKTVSFYIKSYWNKSHKTPLNKQTHHNRYLQASWNKYGATSFKFEVIEQFDSEMNFDLNNLERYWIKQLDSSNPTYGYNLTLGGEGTLGFKHSQEVKENQSKLMRGNIPWNKGITGLTSNRKNYSHSQETKMKISMAKSGTKTTKRKKVVATNLMTLETIIFDCLTDAAKWAKAKSCSKISEVCKGIRNQYKGHKFEYFNEVANVMA